jgi:hypothetical protein
MLFPARNKLTAQCALPGVVAAARDAAALIASEASLVERVVGAADHAAAAPSADPLADHAADVGAAASARAASSARSAGMDRLRRGQTELLLLAASEAAQADRPRRSAAAETALAALLAALLVSPSAFGEANRRTLLVVNLAAPIVARLTAAFDGCGFRV